MDRIKVHFVLLLVLGGVSSVFGQQPKASQVTSSDLTILIYSYPSGSRQEMSATAPDGGKVGMDALTGKGLRSAGNASYAIEGQGDLDNISTPVVKSIWFRSALPGRYRLLVTSKAAGSYDLYVTANCEGTVARKQIRNRRIGPGKSQLYSLHFDSNHCKLLSLAPMTHGGH